MSSGLDKLAPREREIIEVLLANGESTAVDIQHSLASVVGNSAVRSMLSRLKQKGLVSRRRIGRRYVYRAAISIEHAQVRALRNVLHVFFDNSPGKAAVALLGRADATISPAEIEKLETILKQAKERRK